MSVKRPTGERGMAFNLRGPRFGRRGPTIDGVRAREATVSSTSARGTISIYKGDADERTPRIYDRLTGGCSGYAPRTSLRALNPTGEEIVKY